ncbi:MAG: 5-formyltetrahydrofolate cyclo-ligase, partial [Myxococcota bacterium]|nr:5-formyltetrahydrofolate cyclo-ligase [Myxococcota bacterium]
VVGETLNLQLAPIDGLVVGHRGLREPPPDAPGCVLEDLDALLVPGLGYDRWGHRLGQGGGFYDRLLQGKDATGIIGVAFAVQVVPTLPAAPHDVAVTEIVTEVARATAGCWRPY